MLRLLIILICMKNLLTTKLKVSNKRSRLRGGFQYGPVLLNKNQNKRYRLRYGMAKLQI